MWRCCAHSGNRCRNVADSGIPRCATPSGYTLATKGVNYGVYYKMTSPRGDKDKERQPVPQGIEEINTNGEKAKGEKFLQDGRLFIRCGEQVFDIMGHKVK